MSDLFAWFQNYLNLSKLTAVSVPGMVVAFALVLVLGPIPCPQNTKSCPFCSANLKPTPTPASTITSYTIAGGKLTITADNNFAAKDEVTIIGATSRPELNGTWNIDTATSKTFTASKKLIGKGTETGSISNDKHFEADITGSDNFTIQVTDGFAKGDIITIQGVTAQPQLNNNWEIDSVDSEAFKIKTPKLPESTPTDNEAPTANGSISKGSVTAKFTGYSTTKGITTVSYNNGLAANDTVTIAGATLQLELNGKWQIVVPGQTSLTIKQIPLADGSGSETGTAAASKSTKATTDTVIVSAQRWLPSVVIPRVDNPAPLSKEEAADKARLDAEIAKIGIQCSTLPLYVVANSRPDPAGKGKAAGASSSGGGSGDDSSAKKGTPQYADEQTASYQTLWAGSYGCFGELTALDSWLQARIAERQSLNTQEAADLSAFSTSIAAAQASGDRLVARDLSSQVAQKRSDLQRDQTAAKWLTQTEAYVASLINQVKTMQTQLQAQITPAAAPPTASTAGAVFQTIQQNILMFLLFSLIIGQILDPIQRGLVSFTGPRRKVFDVFNQVYGLKGSGGEIRFGDRRLPPWTLTESHMPRAATRLPMGYSSADVEYIDDMNIYDENYAVGAGFITQSEYRVIQDEYFSQSQITSGLIPPLSILSICLGTRFICCSAAASSNVAHASTMIFWIIVSMGLGTAAGVPLSLFMASITSSVYTDIVKNFLSQGGKNKRAARYSTWMVAVIIVLLALLCYSLIVPFLAQESEIPAADLYLVVAPCLLIFPLWLAGLDRLHKYYSEIQSRIAGNILRLQTNTEQKFIDLITNAGTRKSLKGKLKKNKDENEALLKYMEEYFAKQDSSDPAKQDPGAPPGQSGNS
jgi:hypothetical protein